MTAKKTAVIASLSLSFLLSMTAFEERYRLDDLIQIGLRNNPLISASRNEADARRSASLASRSLANPELEWAAGRASSYDGILERGTKEFSLSQNIENPFKRHFRVKALESDWQAALSRSRWLELETACRIKVAFYEILCLERIEALVETNVASIERMQELIQKRADLGEVKRLEAIKLEVEVLKAQKELSEVRTERQLARDRLNTLLGNSLPDNFEVEGELEAEPIPFDEGSQVEKALQRHPQITALEKELESSASSVSSIKWGRFPDFQLRGFSEQELEGTQMGIGISLSIPLWNWKAAEIAEAEYLTARKNDELRAQRLDISAAVRAQARRLRQAEQMLGIFTGGLLNQADESLHIAETSYRQGEISLLDFLDSQRTANSILRDYQQALLRFHVEKAALEKAVGEEIR